MNRRSLIVFLFALLAFIIAAPGSASAAGGVTVEAPCVDVSLRQTNVRVPIRMRFPAGSDLISCGFNVRLVGADISQIEPRLTTAGKFETRDVPGVEGTDLTWYSWKEPLDGETAEFVLTVLIPSDAKIGDRFEIVLSALGETDGFVDKDNNVLTPSFVCGALTVSASGDVNSDGTINSRDLISLMKFILSPSQTVCENADVNADDKINSRDVTALLRFIAGDTTLRLGHNDALTVEEAPTCTKNGRGTVVCRVCGSESSVEIPKADHNYIADVTVFPGCGSPGEIEYNCTMCGRTYRERIPMSGDHKYTSAVTVSPTCACDGVKTHVCRVCGYSFTEKIPATGKHSFSTSVTKPATCASQGLKTSVCKACGLTVTEKIPATGKHSFSTSVTKPATCASQGLKTSVCKVCGLTATEKIPATGKHSYASAVTKAARCGDPGVRTYTCKTCGASYTEAISAPAGSHSYVGRVTAAPTCNKTGTMTYTCTACGDKYTKPIPCHRNTVDGRCKACGRYDLYTCVICRIIDTQIKSSLARPDSLRITAVCYKISSADVNNFTAVVSYSVAGKSAKRAFHVLLGDGGAFRYSESALSALCPKSYSTTYTYNDLSVFG